ncbi:MAG: hypothetical protein KME07_21555 [Pegethrix bostrychoides GSE-TBD4-15B]|jgi:predicted secreted hydrolase|uniref:AttH domain-containing protein n=1 Tax=Pegethrix bostrychoides GSE-TBD4-15B TaxID=2839662 RepID=A0A951PFF4_9CYAN|nr:hypothetical protein [Pegethrix bostrychoides GSE-TBD4-15B]
MGEMNWAGRLLRLTLPIWIWIAGLLWLQPAWAATELSWLETATANNAGFEKALTVKDWNFPQDFGAHNGYQTEWWYYTGNLATETGREFGFQLTFFRQALKPEAEVAINAAEPLSGWRGNQIYSAHFTVSDIVERQFYPAERFSRGTLGLAGAEAEPYKVWLEDWSATEAEPGGELGTVRLLAKTAEVSLDLLVEQRLPPVLQGNRGLSQKGQEPGNASYYYSLVQQPTVGTVTVQGKPYAVTGLTWKDHEYSTSALTAGTVGWDWFSMQFDNGSALMLYLLRHEDGTLEDTSAGIYIAASGETTALSRQDWQVKVLERWKSPQNEALYPAKWQIEIPKLDIALQAEPLMPNQELNVATATYWEGAVKFAGQQGESLLNGRGYVELTGYADRLDRLLSARTP